MSYRMQRRNGVFASVEPEPPGGVSLLRELAVLVPLP
jgi:hypothetical protein